MKFQTTKYLFAGAAILASAGLACAQEEARLRPATTYNFVFTDGCDGMSFTVSGNTLAGTHTGSAECLGGPGPFEISGGAATVSIRPETTATPAWIVTDAYLVSVALEGFWVIDVNHLTWGLYEVDNGTHLKYRGTLTVGTPPVMPNGLPSAAMSFRSPQSGTNVEPATAYSFIFANSSGQPYCDGYSFTVTGRLLAGYHTGSCIGGTYGISGAAGRTALVSGTTASAAYIVSDRYLGISGVTGFFVIDVKHLKWAFYKDDGSETIVENEGVLLVGTPPVLPEGRPSAAGLKVR
jgi:hypothetical protein